MRKPGIASLDAGLGVAAAVLAGAGLASAAFTPAGGRTLGAAGAVPCFTSVAFTSAAFTGTETLEVWPGWATGLAEIFLLASVWALAMAPGLFSVLAMASARASRLSAGEALAASAGLGASGRASGLAGASLPVWLLACALGCRLRGAWVAV